MGKWLLAVGALILGFTIFFPVRVVTVCSDRFSPCNEEAQSLVGVSVPWPAVIGAAVFIGFLMWIGWRLDRRSRKDH